MLAAAAEQPQPRDYMVAGLEFGDLAADRLDDPGRFVTENHRRGYRDLALGDRQVAVTNSRRHRADQHLAAPGLIDVHFLEGVGLVGLVKDRRFHSEVTS